MDVMRATQGGSTYVASDWSMVERLTWGRGAKCHGNHGADQMQTAGVYWVKELRLDVAF